MEKLKLNKTRRLRRKRIIRKKIYGTSKKPRLSVFKSNKEVAAKVGEDIGKKLLEKKINTVYFDRNGFLYTGKIKALADGARKTGIKF